MKQGTIMKLQNGIYEAVLTGENDLSIFIQHPIKKEVEKFAKQVMDGVIEDNEIIKAYEQGEKDSLSEEKAYTREYLNAIDYFNSIKHRP